MKTMKTFLFCFSLIFISPIVFGQNDDEIITSEVSQDEFDNFCETMAGDIESGRKRVGN